MTVHHKLIVTSIKGHVTRLYVEKALSVAASSVSVNLIYSCTEKLFNVTFKSESEFISTGMEGIGSTYLFMGPSAKHGPEMFANLIRNHKVGLDHLAQELEYRTYVEIALIKLDDGSLDYYLTEKSNLLPLNIFFIQGESKNGLFRYPMLATMFQLDNVMYFIPYKIELVWITNILCLSS
jgi:hypothetical protein